MTSLIRPDATRFEEWAQMLAEFEDPLPHGSGMWETSGAVTYETFEAHLSKSALYADGAASLPDRKVHADQYWITDGTSDSPGGLVGFLHFRRSLNDLLLHEGGHVGYSVRPSRRREGHASRALALALDQARALGIERVLVTCDDDNAASAATIESQGGVLEDVRIGQDGLDNRRYWISLGPTPE